jgi:hypothetical protein
MLRGNLATRPFYNERLVALALVVVAAIAVALSVFNARRLLDLSRQRAALASRIDGDDRQAAAIRREANTTSRTVDRKHVEALVAETHEANGLIDQRTFSWTTLFALIERTLPIDVRLVAVSPKIDKDSTLITMLVVSRRPEALADFVAALEGSAGRGTFYDVLKHADQRNEDGTYDATIEAYYLPPVASPVSSGAAAPGAASGSPASTGPLAPVPPGRATAPGRAGRGRQ